MHAFFYKEYLIIFTDNSSPENPMAVTSYQSLKQHTATPVAETRSKGVSLPAVPVQKKIIQKVAEKEELPLQGKFSVTQMKGGGGTQEEEEPIQMKAIQLKGEQEEELPAQGKFIPVQRKENNTGLPDNLKSGVENLSGYAMDDVKVHYNSSQPHQLNAHAYAQGTDIHVAPGQEQHLAHEAWHIVQQKQGRVKPTLQMKQGVPVNDDKGLEHEADVMGAKALSSASTGEKL
jgi:hypothetical protein